MNVTEFPLFEVGCKRCQSHQESSLPVECLSLLPQPHPDLLISPEISGKKLQTG